MSQERVSRDVQLSVRNVGGIDSTEVRFDSGVAVLEGRNATNRTSLLQALMAALGSERVSLKGDADEGRVELAFDGERYSRTLERTNGTVTTGGDPYLDDAAVADLFAFLLETNAARRAVARGDDLRELIMEPVDTAAIQEEISQLESEKQQLDDELGELESLKGTLPDLERERNRLESEIETKREELEAKEAELEAADADVDETREEKTELEEKLGELRETRGALEDVRFDVETEEESLDALREERADLEAEREELSEAPMGEVEAIEERIDRLRGRKASLESELNELQSTIQFNEGMLDDPAESAYRNWLDESASDDSAETDSNSVTGRLLADDESVTCWTCGSEVRRDQVTATLDQLRDRRQEKLDDSRAIEDDLDDLADEKRRLERQQRRREELDRRLDRIETEIDDRTDALETLRERRDGLTAEIGDLETEVEALEDRAYSEVLDLHKEANQLEFELGRLEADLEDVNSEIAAVEDRLGEQAALEGRRTEIREELEDLRTRIDRTERRAVDRFNEHMASVLDRLDYANLERIWIDRSQREVQKGRRKISESVFDLHVVRRSDAGTTYEDTVEHLSESEREVTGLVFALAGYLVHDVYEAVPFILLDSLEAIDSQRIAALVDYLAEYADHLVVALLPEDARAMDADYTRITDI